MNNPIALIVDDEPDIRELLEMTLARMDIETVSAGTVREARSHLERNKFDLCLTDMRLPDGSGIDLVCHIQERFSNIPTAVITAYGSMETAVQALKAGAFDFVSKPVDLEVLRNLVRAAMRIGQRGGESSLELIGVSAAIEETRSMIAKLARSQAPVYISGDSGTGKELVARMIHEPGPRHSGPFVAVNCGAIPRELMESEFFGHMKGSFTGAVADKEGLFRAANGGTLFLDEVAELPQDMQVKLLRAIQEKAIRPVGATRETILNVRILSATHKNLAQMVEAERFRQDLFYRINVIELHIEPLSARPDDIEVLADFLITQLAEQWGQTPPKLHKEALAALQRHPFPGNVRELENILERAMTLCDGSEIRAEDLNLPQAKSVSNNRNPTDPSDLQLESYLGDMEREIIEKALEQNRWNKTKTAKQLGITFRALRYRLKKLGLD
jgi:two-component system response regulator PilR (NtrC family)